MEEKRVGGTREARESGSGCWKEDILSAQDFTDREVILRPTGASSPPVDGMPIGEGRPRKQARKKERVWGAYEQGLPECMQMIIA